MYTYFSLPHPHGIQEKGYSIMDKFTLKIKLSHLPKGTCSVTFSSTAGLSTNCS